MSLTIGNKFLKAGAFDLAIAEYEKIQKSDPLYGYAEFNIQWAQKKQGYGGNQSADLRFDVYGGTTEKPKLSIIMPVFNVAPYLDACILSVRYQTFKNFELIIVNDASTDNGRYIIDMHAKLDSRIRVIDLAHNTLGGAGIPSNIGIEVATGKYIGFVDSDDWLSENAFEVLVKAAEENQADVVLGGFKTFLEQNRECSDAYDLEMFEKLPTNEIISSQDFNKLFRISPVPWRKLYRRSFLDSNQIRFPEGDYFYEDNPLHWFVLLSQPKAVKINEVISHHRMAREGQTMGAADYRLGAMCSHMNTIATFLIKRLDKCFDQSLIDEFFDYCYRCGWVADRQENETVQKIIAKQIANIVRRFGKKYRAQNLRNGFNARIEHYFEKYPDYDLTIVIPTYNCKDFIEATVKTALDITAIKTNILIIDDGSTDSTARICKCMADEYSNIHFFNQNNKGAGRARNSIIPLCTGRYTYFLDADDTIDSRQLEYAVEQADRNGNDLFFLKYKIVYHDKEEVRDMFDADQILWDKFPTATNNAQLRAMVAGLINYPWNRIIKTELLHDANIFFGATVVHNDISFHWTSLLSAQKIGYSNYIVCYHKKFENGAQITNINDERRLNAFDALEFTHRAIVNHENGHQLIDVWGEFNTTMLKWVKDRVPVDLYPQYEIRKCNMQEILDSSRLRN